MCVNFCVNKTQEVQISEMREIELFYEGKEDGF